ncbi:MAG: hypothetical protein ACI9S9_003400 [Planctomycetota bacterium]|jgi:hypothetical protein
MRASRGEQQEGSDFSIGSNSRFVGSEWGANSGVADFSGLRPSMGSGTTWHEGARSGTTWHG